MKIRDEDIIQFVQSHNIRDQAEFVDLLAEAGFLITQASLSRRLKKLNIEKRGGIYQSPTSPLTAPLLINTIKSVQSAPPNMIVIRTQPGCANQLAYQLDLMIDELNLSSQKANPLYRGMAGTVAGDDTILVVISEPEQLGSIHHQILEDFCSSQ